MNAHLVAGLGFGDEGKGSCVDFLVRTTGAKLVVRYNGGPQAAHHVHVGNKVHSFHQYGSGTLAGADTYLSRFMLVNPGAMQEERKVLEDNFGISPNAYIEEGCVVCTPFHSLANRYRETSRGLKRHGSCGFGVGEARNLQLNYHGLTLTVGDLKDVRKTRDILFRLQEHFKTQVADEDTFNLIVNADIDAMAANYRFWSNRNIIVKDGSLILFKDDMIFEGAQGMLIDESAGFAPYNTWTDITFRNAGLLLRDLGRKANVTRIGVLRTYHTRHGVGPFPTEKEGMSFADDNATNPWQGEMRFGYFDAVLAKYAIDNIGGVDGICMNHIDHMEVIPCVESYNVNGLCVGSLEYPDTQMLYKAKVGTTLYGSPEEVAKLIGTQVLIASHGPRAEDKYSMVREYA